MSPTLPLANRKGKNKSTKTTTSTASSLWMFHKAFLFLISGLIVVLVWMQASAVHVNVNVQLLLDEKMQQTKQEQAESNLLGAAAAAAAATATTTRAAAAAATLFSPVNCAALKHNTKIPDPNAGRTFHAVANATSTKPFVVSLLDPKIDAVRWDVHTYGRYYERALEDLWADLLRLDAQKDRSLHVLDVGANVGYYSMYSAAVARDAKRPITIWALEPNPINLLRGCESIQLNHWMDHDDNDNANAAETDNTITPRIQFWQYGLSNRDGTLQFRFGGNNPGAGKIVSDAERQRNQGGFTDISISVLTLDQFAVHHGWLHATTFQATSHAPRMTIMKIDVERHEAQVILGGPNFLKAQLARNIMTEVGGPEETENVQEQTQALQVLVEAGYVLCGIGNYRGPGNMPMTGIDTRNEQGKLIDHLMQKVSQPGTPYLNVWWQAAALGDDCARR